MRATHEAVDWTEQLLRAVLFVPGNDPRKQAKVGAAGADLVVIDLEDAVAVSEKTAARAVTRNAIPAAAKSGIVGVRINGIESGRLEDDIAAVVTPGLHALVVPKVEQLDTLRAAGEALARAEREQGLPSGTVALIALVETPLGVARCEEILLQAPSRTVAAIFGLADFSAALGVDVTSEGSELFYARGRLIVAARAAGLPGPVDGPYLDVDDTDGLLADSRRSRALGFQGRVALHPRQVAPITRAFSELTEAQLAAARRIVEAFEGAESGGVASIRVDGRFVDYPIYQLARTKLRRHDSYLANS
jgi:citrate lyase subunit beta / citryl-CoA lyase